MKTLKESLNNKELIILSDKLPLAEVPDNIRMVVNGELETLYGLNCESLFITGNCVRTRMPDTIKYIYFDKTIKYTDWYICSGCTSLEKAIILGKIDELQAGFFNNCNSLKEIIIPNSVKKIRDWCFADCHSLKEITLPEDVDYIGKGCFEHCKSLKEITLPGNIKFIGEKVFIGCPSLKRITCPNKIREMLLKDKSFRKSIKFNIL